MDCTECSNYIQPFLKKELDFKDKRNVLKHISKCDKCKKELKTYFLVIEGMKRLENGNDYNLISDFDTMYNREKQENNKIYKERIFIKILLILIFTVTVLTLLISFF